MSDLKPEFQSRAEYLNDINLVVKAVESCVFMTLGAAVNNIVIGQQNKALECFCAALICLGLHIVAKRKYRKDITSLLQDSQELEEVNAIVDEVEEFIKGREEEILEAVLPESTNHDLC